MTDEAFGSLTRQNLRVEADCCHAARCRRCYLFNALENAEALTRTRPFCTTPPVSAVLPSLRSRRVGAIGMKCGMTQAWSASGERVPLTVIELQDLQVTKVRTPLKDGVCALQLAGGWEKRKRMTTSEARVFETKGMAYKSYLREFPVTEDALLPVGTSITALHLCRGSSSTCRRRRAARASGAVRRWGFKGQSKTHGTTKAERKIGSMGGAAGSMFATRVFKGKKMAGRMGNRRRTVQGLLVWKVVPKYNLVYCKGSIPGARGCEVRLRDSMCRKQEKFKAATPLPFPTILPGDALYGSEEERSVA